MTEQEMNQEIDRLAESLPAVQALKTAYGYDIDKWPAHLRSELFERLDVKPTTVYVPLS